MLVCCKGRDALVLNTEVSQGLYFHGSFQKDVTLYQLQNIPFSHRLPFFLTSNFKSMNDSMLLIIYSAESSC